MSYNDKYLKDLIEINQLIDEKKFDGNNGAIEKFKTHIKEVAGIGRFSIESWNEDWRKKVYRLGEKFVNLDPVEFLKIIHEISLNLHKDNQEVLDFYYSEIEMNSLPEDPCSKRCEALIEKYPYNPEFRHSLGHFYANKKKYVEAIEQYKFAFNKDKENETFTSTLFNSYKMYCDNLIENEKYDTALEICDNLIKEGVFSETIAFHNILVSTKDRIKDYIVLNEKINKAEADIRKKVEEDTKSWQFKTIEILSFFSAIIAFIFSTVSIGKNFDFKQAIVFNIALGITLILFVLVLNLIFSEKGTIRKTDFRIILVAIFTLSLLTLIYIAYYGFVLPC